jgi:hypothetical protein
MAFCFDWKHKEANFSYKLNIEIESSTTQLTFPKQQNGCFLPTKAPVPSTMCGLMQTENNTLSEKLAI